MKVWHTSVFQGKANANPLHQSTGHNIDKQPDNISAQALNDAFIYCKSWLFERQFLFRCATNDPDKELIRQICLVGELRSVWFLNVIET